MKSISIPPFLLLTSLRHNYLLNTVPESSAFSNLIRHLLDGAVHLVISLALALEPVHKDKSPDTQVDHPVEEPPDELVTVAPQLGHKLKRLVYDFVHVTVLSVPDSWFESKIL